MRKVCNNKRFTPDCFQCTAENYLQCIAHLKHYNDKPDCYGSYQQNQEVDWHSNPRLAKVCWVLCPGFIRSSCMKGIKEKRKEFAQAIAHHQTAITNRERMTKRRKGSW